METRYDTCWRNDCDREPQHTQNSGWWNYFLCAEHAAEEALVHRYTCPECSREHFRRRRAWRWPREKDVLGLCSLACAHARDARRQRERRATVAKPTMACAHCDTTFTPTRKDAKFCSTRCRVAAHRAKG